MVVILVNYWHHRRQLQDVKLSDAYRCNRKGQMVKYNTVNMKYISAIHFFSCNHMIYIAWTWKILNNTIFALKWGVQIPKSAFWSNCDYLLSFTYFYVTRP